MSTSLATTQLHRPPSFVASVDQVLSYEHPALIARLQEKLGIARDAAVLLFDDTKRFLFLCSMTEETISPNEILDFGWHEFILFMKDYEVFCKDHFGRVIYHRPHHPDDASTKGEGGRRALELAQKMFAGTLSKNWDYPKLDSAEGDPCGDNCGCQPSCNTD